MWRNRKRNKGYFMSLALSVLSLTTKDQIKKFDSKVAKGTFLGYSEIS